MTRFNKIFLSVILSIFIFSCDRITDPSITTTPSKSSGSPDIHVDTGNGVITSENGPVSDTFTIVLAYQPSSNVTIGTFTSSDTSEVTVSPASLLFTTANWNVPQTVTVTGVDDAIADNYQVVSISLGTAVGAEYDGLSAGLVYVTNLDDDVVAQNVIILNDGLITKEDPSTPLSDSFQVVLSSAPSTNVTIATIASSDTGEATVSPSTLTFTTANWNTPQSVTVTGVDDLVPDGLQTIYVNFSNTSSTDATWNGVSIGSLTVYNIDDEAEPVPGINVISGPMHLTGESGISNSFNVVLDSQPTADVNIIISSSDTTEGQVIVPSGGILTFTSANWNIPQSVNIQGQDDTTGDGNIDYTIILATATSSDTDYNGIDPADVNFRNIDDDTIDVVVSTGDGLITKEDPATPLADSFQVVLSSAPSANVTITTISSSDTGEATVSPSTLTFTTANWSTPQTVTVTGVDDLQSDGIQSLVVSFSNTSSTDSNWNNLSISSLTVYNIDDEPSSGISVMAGPLLLTGESGISSSFNVVLNSQPTADVAIAVSSSDTTEGMVTSPSGGSLTFTTTNWNTPQTVVVQGLDDSTVDGNIDYTITLGAASSTDTDYNGIDPGDVNFRNIDDDAVDIIVSIGDGLITREDPVSPLSDTFQVVLSTQPSGTVNISGISSSDTGEVNVTPASLTFTPTNWDVPQTVTVTGVDDAFVDSTQKATINMGTVSSSDTAYNGFSVPAQTVYNIDDDSLPSVVVIDNPFGYYTNEGGLSTAIRIVLNRQPTADVTLGPISTDNNAEGDVNVSSLTFTSSDWARPHEVIVTGAFDGSTGDGSIPYTIDLGTTSSSDPDFDGLDPGDVTVTNRDFTGLNDYLYSSGSVSYESISPAGTGTGIPVSFFPVNYQTYPDPNDAGYFILNFGFTFYFLQSAFNSIIIYTDGFASFNSYSYSEYTFHNEELFDSYYIDEFVNILAPWWDDIINDTGGVYYQVNGTEGTRKVIIEWYNARVYAEDDLYSFQIVLYEVDNAIEFIFGPSSNVDATDGTTASTGIKEDAALIGVRDFFIETLTGFTDSSDGNYSSLERAYGDYPTTINVYRFEPPW